MEVVQPKLGLLGPSELALSGSDQLATPDSGPVLPVFTKPLETLSIAIIARKGRRSSDQLIICLLR